MNEFFVTSDPNDVDITLVHAFISQSYWAKGIPLETVKKSILNSLVFGVYSNTKQQVGFARVITDKATFAYLGDVFILEAFRGLGLSILLMEAISIHDDLQGLRRFMLATSDAHGLYEKFGFKPLENSSSLMQVWQPSIYE